MADEKKAMVISPAEITQAGRLDASRRVIGRVVHTEETNDVLKVFLSCGPSRRQLLELETWKELKAAAQHVFKKSELVALTGAMMGTRRQDRAKYSLSGCRMIVRFEKDLKVDPVPDSDRHSPVPLCPALEIKDLPHTVPFTSLAAAVCLKDGAVAVRVRVTNVAELASKTDPDRSLCRVSVWDVDEKQQLCEADIVGFGQNFIQNMKTLVVDSTYELWPLQVLSVKEKHGFQLKWLNNTLVKKITGTLQEFQVKGIPKQLSMRTEYTPASQSRPDYASKAAYLVAVSTMAHLLPDKGVHKFSADDV